MNIIKVSDETAVIAKLSELVEISANKAILDHGVFRIGLSGGSLIKYMAQVAKTIHTDWSKWKLFFCDERYVIESDEDSTYGAYKQLFVPHTQLKENQFLIIDMSLELSDCAHAYEQEIYKQFDIQDVSAVFTAKKRILISCFPPTHSLTLRPFQNLICSCWAWDRMVILVRCFHNIDYWPKIRF